MSGQDLPHVEVHDNGYLYIENKPLYICKIHELGEVDLPFYVESEASWGEKPKTAKRISQWELVPGYRTSTDKEVEKDLNRTEKRPHKQKTPEVFQATY